MFDTVPREISYAIYADDCTIWTQGHQIRDLFQAIQSALQLVGNWSLDNGFIFSAEKSYGVLFRRGLRRVDLTSFPTLIIHDEPIPMAERVKYLGVWLDDKLNLSAHIKCIKARTAKRLASRAVAGGGS